MRTTTSPELTVLAATTRRESLRVKVANGSGTMIDLSNWVVAYSIDQDKDQPVSGASVSFVRASGTTQSFSPLRTDSTLNLKDDLVTYSPQLDINRAITIELATTAAGTAPVAGDYKLLFKGTIDVVDFESTPVTVICRDLGATIVDRWVETPKAYGSGPGVAYETVMQSILDDNFGSGVIPIYKTAGTSYVISPAYQQQVQSIMDAMVALAQNPGDDIRYKWDDGTSSFRFTLNTPPRSKTTPDYTFGPSAYFDVTLLSLDITNIRNVIIVSFADSNNQYNRATVLVSDSASITKYGRRTFIITEGDTSPVNTVAEATALGNAALADLKDPKADMEVDMPLFWPGDLDDLYRWSPNIVHYNTNQDIAVVAIKHSGSMTDKGMKHRTHLKVRGTPIGQYVGWLGRGGTFAGGANSTRPPIPFIVPLNTEATDASWNMQFYATNGTGGGGTNLTYTVKSKLTFGTETTVSSGNASAFPLTLAIARDPKQGKVITFTLTDAATGLVAADHVTIPALTPSISASGTIIGAQIDPASVTPVQTQARNTCRVWNSVNQSIPNATPTNLTFDSEFWDVGGLHSTSALTDRITVPTGGAIGTWFVSATVEFAANATGHREIRLYHLPFPSGPGFLLGEAHVMGFTDGGVGPCVTISGMAIPALAGDYFVVQVWQNSTAALNALTLTTQFTATHLW